MDSTTTNRATKHRFHFIREGHNGWEMVFSDTGRMARGSTRATSYWWLDEGCLVLANDDGEPNYRLHRNGNDSWQGRSVRNSGECVKLIPDAGSELPQSKLRPEFTASDDVSQVAELFRGTLPADWHPGWWRNDNVQRAHRYLAREAIEQTPPFPQENAGRGIVICAGGARMFTNAWVCLRMLRHWGCKLPVQLWHLGEEEIDDAMRALVADYGAECVDAEQVRQRHPVRTLGGWELKAYSILHCPFREVILLDADNVPLLDPAVLFDTPEYAQHGALFWPDYGRMEAYPTIWDVCEVEHRDEPEFESGQIVVDKQRSWVALNLAMHYNEHSDFYYRHMLGDKETFHMAFHRTGKSFAMPATPIENLANMVMCQHDFDGRRIFQHRNQDKWRLDGSNCRIQGFSHEDLCREFLTELRERWSGCVHWNDSPTPAERTLIDEIGGRVYQYTRVGFDERPIELLSDGRIGAGAGACEQTWTVTTINGVPTLNIFGQGEPTCRLTRHDGAWTGRWCRHERMPVTLHLHEVVE